MKYIRGLVEFIYPRCCYLCDAKLSSENSCICPVCIGKLPRTFYHRIDMNRMEQRFAGKFPFEHAAGHFFYARNSELSVLMQDLKYRHARNLARQLGEIIGKELYLTPFLSDIDCIAPIPMHYLKKALRGYNQTEQIAIGFNKATGIEIISNLEAYRAHKTQTAMTLDQRIQNTSNIFRVKNPSRLNGKHILLLDDVCTTGSTLTSAATTLLAANPSIRLSILTVGVTF